jgi:hypothetical protein
VTPKTKQALELALSAMENRSDGTAHVACLAIREALAEPEHVTFDSSITALLDQIERLQEERVALRATVAGLVKWTEDIAHETRVRDLMNLISSVGARAPSH